MWVDHTKKFKKGCVKQSSRHSRNVSRYVDYFFSLLYDLESESEVEVDMELMLEIIRKEMVIKSELNRSSSCILPAPS